MKIKTQHQHIHKENSLRRNLLKLTSKTDKNFSHNVLVTIMHKTPIGARFLVSSKNHSTKPLSDGISKVFKIIFILVESFDRKSYSTHVLKRFGL